MRLRLSLVPVLVLVLLAPAALAVQIQVEGLQDSLAGAPTINHCTLRKAIVNANHDAAIYPQCQAGSGHDEIVFNLPGTVTFALAGINEDGGVTGDLDITDDLTIIGHPGGTTIDANLLDRIFDIRGAGVEVTIVDLHLFNGRGLGGAGGIQLSEATLNLNNVTINGCSADGGDGGAIASVNGATLNMTNCLVTGNAAAHHAGAISIETGVANITNCTIVSNGSGFSNLTGGIRSGGVTNLRNTIVAGNEDGGDLPNLDGFFTSLGYNIVGELGTNPANPTIVATVGDQFDVAFAALNIGVFQNNGGPVPTRGLGPGSIAIDAGHSSGSAIDQRSFVRPCDDPLIANAAGGDGADVGAFEVQNGVCGSNADPDALDDAATVDQDSGANAIDVLANDTDADGDPLTIASVTQGANGSVTNNGTSVSYTPNAGFTGADSFTYTVDDGNGGTDTATVSVTVNDTQPPTVTASVAVGTLWSPNNKLVDVGLTFDDGDAVSTSVTVYSDEDDGASSDASGMLLLRAERSGSGDGRFYLIRIAATDAANNTSYTCLTVLVPKSQSAAHVAAVTAEAAAAQSACSGAGLFVVGD